MTNKVAVVTGATGGIGKALTLRLIKEGVRVIPIDLRRPGLEGIKCDFTKPNITSLVGTGIHYTEKKIDYLFNVAGIGIYKDIISLPWEEFENSFRINVLAPFILSKNIIPRMKNSKDPMIFNVGSVMGITPTAKRTAYCMSKYAMRGFSLSLAEEIGDSIDVCLLTLGSVMDNFGTGGIQLRKELEKSGKKYLSIDQVVDKIIEITNSSKREREYILKP